MWDLVPYRHCLDKMPAVMTGHVWISSVEEKPLPIEPFEKSN